MLKELEELEFYEPLRIKYPTKKGIFSWRSPKNYDGFGSLGRRLDYCFLSPYFPDKLVESISYHPEYNLSDHFPMIIELKSLSSLNEDFKLRKEWEKVDLDEAQEEYDTLYKDLTSAFLADDNKEIIRLQNEIATSKNVQALSVNEAAKAKTSTFIKERSWRAPENKMRALKEIDLFNHSMDDVFYFETEEKGKLRQIGKLSKKDHVAHFLVAQMIKPYHDLTHDEHSYAYISEKSNLDLHHRLCKYFTENEELDFFLFIDIDKFFDCLDHNWLYENVPIEKEILKNILDTYNIRNKERTYCGGKGISMGSPVAAFLSNLTLDGLEDFVVRDVKDKFGEEVTVKFLRFCDDIVILTSKHIHANYAYDRVAEFLSSRGLKINSDKSYVKKFRKEPVELMHWKYRFAGENLIVEPTQNRVEVMKNELYDLVFDKNLSQLELIKKINKKITGWGRYLRYCDSSYACFEIDHFLEKILLEKVKNAHRFLDEEILKSRYFVTINGKNHFCHPKDKGLYVRKLSNTPLIKEMESYKDLSDTERGKKRVNEKYRSAWRRQNGKCAICGEAILPNEERSFRRIDDKNSYVHRDCLNIETYKDDLVFDLTTPQQVEKAVLMEEPFLTERYLFPGMVMRRNENYRREFHRMKEDSFKREVNRINTRKKEYRKINHYFNKACRTEGFLSLLNENQILVRREQKKERHLRIPLWIYSDILSEDKLIQLKNFQKFLYEHYDL